MKWKYIYNLSGVYETPGGAILLAAHIDIEVFTMDRVGYSQFKFYFINNHLLRKRRYLMLCSWRDSGIDFNMYAR